MKLIFLRHGIAEDKGYTDDAKRKLTPEGIDKLHQYIPFLAAYAEKKNLRSGLLRKYGQRKQLKS